MPGYLELLRQERIKAGEVCPPIRYMTTGKPRNLVNSSTPSPFLHLSPDANIKNKFFNDINEGVCFEREHPYEVTRLTRFGGVPAYSGAFEALLARCPEGVLNSRYMQAVTDAEDFLTAWGEQAAASGWAAEELFGLGPVAPLSRYDVMGLIWLLQGCPVVALTGLTAVIRRATGNELTFYRKDVEFPWRHGARP